MSTIANTISVMKVSQYLASAKVALGALFGGGKEDPRLPYMLYTERRFLAKIYDYDPTYTDIQAVSDYCYALCWAYAAQAEYILSISGGGSVSPVTPAQSYPIYITEADFDSATFYPNTNIFGNSVIIFLNEINRYLIPYTEFTVSSTGITITLAGFDATTFTYNLVIEKVYT